MSNRLLTFAPLTSPVGDSFRNVIVPFGFWVTINLLAELVEAASITGDFGGGESSSPKTATGEAEALKNATTTNGGAVRQLICPNCTKPHQAVRKTSIWGGRAG